MTSIIGDASGPPTVASNVAANNACCAPTPQMQQGVQFFQVQQGSSRSRVTKSVTVIPQDGKDTERLAAVVVSIRSGGSYDDLFCRVKQKAAEGMRVACYLVQNHSTEELKSIVEGEGGGEEDNVAAQMRADIAMVDPAAVVFNWECCGGCSGDTFSSGHAPTTLMAALISKGYMVMVSDFSLGALIKHWDTATLGANPFKKVGEFSQQLTLRFDPATLLACEDSAQLQMLGELCASGEAHVHAMGGTKAFTVDKRITPEAHPEECAHGWTDVEVLTIVTALGGKEPSAFTRDEDELCSVGEHKGLAGHVVMRYPSGGRLLASCPHWIELSKLDVNAEQLLQVAEARYGVQYASSMRREMERFGGGAAGRKKRKSYVASSACKFVQQSVPAKYSKSSSSKIAKRKTK